MKRHSLRRSIEPKEGHKTTGASKNIFSILYLMYRSNKAGGIQSVATPLAIHRKLRHNFYRKLCSSEKGGMMRKEGLVGVCDAS